MDTKEEADLCIVLAGSIDAGKSSTMGVLSSYNPETGEYIWDNGDGSARKRVAKHSHEIEAGATSDISTRQAKLTADKNAMMVDLCGHEKYLKTTLFGLTGYFPDYAILVVAGNKGIRPMTKEHMKVLICLKIPFVILITRVDLVADNENIYMKTIKSIKRYISKVSRQKKLVFLNTTPNKQVGEDEKATCSLAERIDKLSENFIKNHNIVPVITVSNKTGYYIDETRQILSKLVPRKWEQPTKGTVFFIEDKFNVDGVGLVVSGILKGDPINVGDHLYIGPINKEMVGIRVWSIHDNFRNPTQTLYNKQRGCLAFRVTNKRMDLVNGKISAFKGEIKKNWIRKGTVVVNADADMNIGYEFEGSVRVLSHSTTITNRYSPVIHCGNSRQTGRITLMVEDDDQHHKKAVKMNEELPVKFRYVMRPVYMEPGMVFFFREGTTRGVGQIHRVIKLNEDADPNPAIEHKRRKKRRERPSNRVQKSV